MKLRILALLAFSVALVGCQTGMKRLEPLKKATPVYVVDYVPSSWAMPIGAVIPEDSSLVLHREASKAAGVGALFGVVGVLVAQASAKNTTRKEVPAVETLRDLKMKQVVDGVLEDLRASGDLPQILSYVASKPGGTAMEVKSYILLEVDGAGRAQVSVFVKVDEKTGVGNDGGWKGQYLRHLPYTLTTAELKGDQSEEIAHKLRADVLEATKVVVRVMANDMGGVYADREEKPVLFMPKDVVAWRVIRPLDGRYVGKTVEGYELVRTNIPSAAPWFWGLAILDPEQVDITPKKEKK